MQPENVVSMEAKVRRLTPRGLIEFEKWLDSRNEKNWITRPLPHNLYRNPDFSEAVDGVGTLPISVSSKFEMAAAINNAIGSKRAALLHDDGFWTAMTVFYIDCILPEANGRREIKSGNNNFLMPSEDEIRENAKAYRHRVWGPCYLHDRFGDMSRAFLTGDIAKLSDGMDALIYYNQAYESVVKAVDAMYIDVDGNFIGDGNQQTQDEKVANLRKGEIRDFIQHCRQIGYTHSLARVSPEFLISEASEMEFGPQIENYRRRKEAGDLPWHPRIAA